MINKRNGYIGRVERNALSQLTYSEKTWGTDRKKAHHFHDELSDWCPRPEQNLSENQALAEFVVACVAIKKFERCQLSLFSEGFQGACGRSPTGTRLCVRRSPSALIPSGQQ
ncbi:hypothetical protein NX722_08240 [Endozoicomonas gorgoniicola]|uniref:Uncharacterized protein n=1 Tax=Endozoicomonas gorgoniicola TaxID=1234144 RepID=A0ABT3MTD7_9GAMM|nr:hypothetical protein [Endozoicomonas gorgoniicola]MCW7552635.1 hypothetical protein [Endozoicomonas gorgoniicola]